MAFAGLLFASAAGVAVASLLLSIFITCAETGKLDAAVRWLVRLESAATRTGSIAKRMKFILAVIAISAVATAVIAVPSVGVGYAVYSLIN